MAARRRARPWHTNASFGVLWSSFSIFFRHRTNPDIHIDALLLPRLSSTPVLPTCPCPAYLTSPPHPTPLLALYDHLSLQTLTTLECLLRSLSHEHASQVRRKIVNTFCDIANQGMTHGRRWHALQAQGCPNLVMDLQMDTVLTVAGITGQLQRRGVFYVS
jgi:hypothetical protein